MAEWTRLERAYRLLVEVGHALLHAPGEAELTREVCRSAVEIAGYRLAWVGYVDDEPPSSVRAVAHFGYDDGYVARAEITLGSGVRGEGPTGRAVCRRASQVAQDIATAPEYEPWRADALARGYGSSAAIPLLKEDRCYGALNVYAPEPDAFDTREIELLEVVAADLIHGILAARGRHELARLTSALGRRATLGRVNRAAAVYAHDIANHLYVIGACFDALTSEVADAPADVVADGWTAIEQATRLTRAVLRGAREGAVPAITVTVDEALEGLRGELTRLLGERVALELALDAPEAALRLPAGALGSVMCNLADNARDAMPEGGVFRIATQIVQLTHPLSARWLGARPGRYVSLRASDTGVGIPEAIRERIFDPFFTTKAERGTGIGLASVYELVVDQLDGAIAFESKIGVGTTFEILLPLADDAAS